MGKRSCCVMSCRNCSQFDGWGIETSPITKTNNNYSHSCQTSVLNNGLMKFEQYKMHVQSYCHCHFNPIGKMLKFLTRPENESGKRKLETTCDKVSSDKLYDTVKRSRTFQLKWKENYEWLRHDSDLDKMFCVSCEKYPSLAGRNVFVTGTDKYRVDPIKSHHNSSSHKACATQHLHDITPGTPKKNSIKVANTPCGIMIQKLSADKMERMRVLFNTAYYLATSMRPFSDFKGLCELQEMNGLEIGNMYRNDMACREFTDSIQAIIHKDKSDQVLKSNFISILSDGSTDVSVHEQEVVYVRYVDNGKIQTDMIDIVNLNSSDASGVMDGLTRAIGTIGLTFEDLNQVENGKPTLVSANFDGASVMQGLKTGTMSKILEAVPWTIPMHCVAHKLELAALDAVKRHSYLKKFEEIVKGLYCFYHFSPKRRREVKEIADILDSQLFHISGIKQVRWLSSKSKALQGIRKNITVIRTHLEHVAERKSSDEAARAKGYLRDLTTVKFMAMLHIMCDITEILQSLSQKFQEQSLLVCDVYPAAEATILQLESLKHDKGQNMKEFEAHFDGEAFDGMELKGGLPDESLLAVLADDLITYIDKRFQNFNEAPLKSFSAFDYHQYPENRTELSRHGREEIQQLLDHFPALFPTEDHSDIHKEYIQMKVVLAQYKTLDIPKSEVFGQILRSDKKNKAAKKLLEIMLVVSPSTAECERGFSLMNNIKTVRRNCLKQDTLQMLMSIHSAAKLTQDDINRAIGHWVTSGTGGKHI